jgi:hypothetical protein
MFLSKFLNFRNFYIFWGIIGLLLGVAWVRYLVEPKRTAASVGMTRFAAFRTLAVLSAGWYVIWAAARGLSYVMSR